MRVGRWSESRADWHKKYFNRYFGRYFGAKSLNQITATFADDYWAWRISFWNSPEGIKISSSNPARRNAKTRGTKNHKKTPSNKTLQMEQSALNEIFRHALRHARITTPVTLKVPRRNLGDERRPAFDLNEWSVLVEQLDLWRKCEGKYASDKLNKHHKLRRLQLRCYVLFLSQSGLRPGEANKTRWEDIILVPRTQGGFYLTIKVRADTKTGSRVVHPLNGASANLDLWKQFVASTNPQHLLWSGIGRAGADGPPPQTDANKTFQEFLKSVDYCGRPNGLLCDADGKRRTLYSLRHTYATFMLMKGAVSESYLAKVMGTSVKQIEKHYSHITSFDRAEELTAHALPGTPTQAVDGSPWVINLCMLNASEASNTDFDRQTAAQILDEAFEAYAVAVENRKLVAFTAGK